MDNPFDQLRQAISQAREANRAVEAHANTMVDLLEPNLRHVSPYRLKALKRQLQDFNAHTQRWKA